MSKRNLTTAARLASAAAYPPMKSRMKAFVGPGEQPRKAPSNYTKITDMSMLKPGDHVAAYRKNQLMPIGFYHHAIYIGNGEVVDYTDDSSVNRYSYEQFKNQCHVYRVEYGKGQCLPATEVVANANKALQEGFGEYKVVYNNCEHFATKMKTGKAVSTQADTMKHALGEEQLNHIVGAQ